jgi:hypothetical protein
VILNTLGTPLKISNAALALLGDKPITSFEDGTPAGLILGQIYEPWVRAALTSSRWRFNMKQAVLTRIAGGPARRFQHWFQMPTDALAVHGVYRDFGDDRGVDFDHFEDRIHTTVGEHDRPIAEYSYRAPESRWTPAFSTYVIETLAAEIAAGLTSRPELRGAYQEAAEYRRRMAASMESQNRTPQRVDTMAFVRRRRGGK